MKEARGSPAGLFLGDEWPLHFQFVTLFLMRWIVPALLLTIAGWYVLAHSQGEVRLNESVEQVGQPDPIVKTVPKLMNEPKINPPNYSRSSSETESPEIESKSSQAPPNALAPIGSLVQGGTPDKDGFVRDAQGKPMDTDSREKASAVCDGHGMHLPTIRELVLLYANLGMRVIDVTSANFAELENDASRVAAKNSDGKLNDFVTRNEGWAPPSRNAGQVWLWSSSVDSREGLSHEPLIFNAVNGVVNSCCSNVDGSHAAHFGFIRCAAGVTKSPSQLH